MMLNNIIALMKMYLKIAFSSNRNCVFNNERWLKMLKWENGDIIGVSIL